MLLLAMRVFSIIMLKGFKNLYMSKVSVNIPNIVGSRIMSKEDSSNKDTVLS